MTPDPPRSTEQRELDIQAMIEMFRPETIYTRLPLAERIKAARSEVSMARARGRCVTCAEGFARSKYNLPADVDLRSPGA